MEITKVYHFKNERELTYVGISAKRAVICAYAQFTKRDWNTWNYDKYESEVVEGEFSFWMGEYFALKH